MANMKISPPWITYLHQMETLFAGDEDISVEYEEEENKIVLRVKGTDKANALSELIPQEKAFGNVTVKTVVIPANTAPNRADLIEMALKGNSNFVGMTRIKGVVAGDMNFAVFAKKVAQFWNDNMGDLHGNESCLYADLAREIFGGDGSVLYCTDNRD